jgi:hypothetical protein
MSYTQPDGLWISLGIARGDTQAGAVLVDCVAIESCSSPQNFSDKRSRYAARTVALVLELPVGWLDAKVKTVGRGGPMRPRRDRLRGNLPNRTVSLPVRHLRVLYALPDDQASPSLYERIAQKMVLEAHEYICPQRMLGQWNLKAMQDFLKRMAPGLLRYP